MNVTYPALDAVTRSSSYGVDLFFVITALATRDSESRGFDHEYTQPSARGQPHQESIR